MNKLKSAVLKTLVYADIFDYPLTLSEIGKWLIQIKKGNLLSREFLSPLKRKIEKTKGYYHLKNRSQIVNLRLKRRCFSQLKLKKAERIIKILSFIPSIDLIAITGALAMNNSDQNDDIDLMIITKSNRLWLTRLFTIFILEFFHLRRRPLSSSFNQKIHKNKICLNLFLDQLALTIPQSHRNLYIAHEVCQIKPLVNKTQTYEKFISANSWIKNYLPNAIKVKEFRTSASTLATSTNIEASSEPLAFLNLLAFHFQYHYMKSKITNEKVSLHSAFFHPRPTGKIILKRYQQKLKNLNFNL